MRGMRHIDQQAQGRCAGTAQSICAHALARVSSCAKHACRCSPPDPESNRAHAPHGLQTAAPQAQPSHPLTPTETHPNGMHVRTRTLAPTRVPWQNAPE
jgi:hypothetical protein